MRPFMTHCGRTNIKHCREKKVVNLILGSELVQQEKQTQHMIVLLWFNGAYASLLRKDELILAPKKGTEECTHGQWIRHQRMFMLTTVKEFSCAVQVVNVIVVGNTVKNDTSTNSGAVTSHIT